MGKKTKPITSTGDCAQTVLSAETPYVEPVVFTEADFLNALKKASRKQEPPAEPNEEKPKT